MVVVLKKEEFESWLKTPAVSGKHLLEPSKKFSGETGFPAKILEDCRVTNEGEIHEFEGDLWQCLEGEVTFVCGGEFENPERHPEKNGEWKGSGIKGGTETTLGPGDWLWIPPGEPHLHKTGGTARLIIIKIPTIDLVQNLRNTGIVINYMKRIAAKILATSLFRPYYRFRFAWPVWYYFLNGKARRHFKNGRADPIVSRIVADLRRDGIAKASLEELFPGENLLEKLNAYAAQLREKAEVQPDKPYLLMLWKFKNDNCVLDFSNPFVNLSLNDKILDVVNGYMGMLSKFHYYTLNVTLPVHEGTQATKSQRWHRDHEDKRMCKMFIYLNDVDETAGPFIYARGTQYGGRWHHVLPPKPPRSLYPSEGEVEKHIPQDDIQVNTAKAGTVIFCDTMGLHKGGYATKKERLMFTAEYSSPASLIPLRYNYPDNFGQEVQKLSPSGQFAVDGNVGLMLNIMNAISRFSIKHYLY